jgi:glycopeptide antibiotics resistance protein
MRNRRIWWIVALLVAAWLLWMTLRAEATVTRELTPVTESAAGQLLGTHLLISILGNIAVFVPLGAAVALALDSKSTGRQIGLGTASGAGLSAAIELLQLAQPSRWTDPADWVLNTLGAALGAFVATVFRKYLQRKV